MGPDGCGSCCRQHNQYGRRLIAAQGRHERWGRETVACLADRRRRLRPLSLAKLPGFTSYGDDKALQRTLRVDGVKRSAYVTCMWAQLSTHPRLPVHIIINIINRAYCHVENGFMLLTCRAECSSVCRSGKQIASHLHVIITSIISRMCFHKMQGLNCLKIIRG